MQITEKAGKFLDSVLPEGHVAFVGAYRGGCAGVKVDMTPFPASELRGDEIHLGYVAMDQDAWRALQGVTMDIRDTALGVEIVFTSESGSCACGQSIRHSQGC